MKRALQQADFLLEPYFGVVKEGFLEDPRVQKLKRTRMVIDPEIHDTPRHFAACQDDGGLILLTPELAELEAEHVLAVLAHECGHACDFLYPGHFTFTEQGRPAAWRDKPSSRHLTRWRDRSPHEIEVTADAIATLILGAVIRYAGECDSQSACMLLQTFSQGVDRPEWLR